MIYINNNLLDKAAEWVFAHDGLLLDIRTMAEFCEGHVCGATLVIAPVPPFHKIQVELLWRRLRQATATRLATTPIVVYCRKGVRASLAKKLLQRMGFRNVMSLGGVETQPLRGLVTGRRSHPNFNICQCP